MAGEQDTFDLYKDKRGEWRWRRLDANGKIVGSASEGYKSKGDAESNMHRGAKPTDKLEFYKDKRGEWRWRRKASNGQIVGSASGGFKEKSDAEANAARNG